MINLVSKCEITIQLTYSLPVAETVEKNTTIGINIAAFSIDDHGGWRADETPGRVFGMGLMNPDANWNVVRSTFVTTCYIFNEVQNAITSSGRDSL